MIETGPYQCVFGVEVAEGAQHPGGGVQVLVLLQQLGEPEVRDLDSGRRRAEECRAEVVSFDASV